MIKRSLSVLTIALVAIALVACGKKAGASTPTEAFTSFFAAAKAKDAATIKRLMSKESLASYEAQAKERSISLDEALVNGTQKGIPNAIAGTQNEKIDGDTATLEFKAEGSENWRTVRLAKEDGEWKVIFR